MTIPLLVNGITFNYPQVGDRSWGVQATSWATAVTTGMLQKAGGAFTLTADVDFGANFGLKSTYYKSRNADPASTGIIRLGNGETIAWRNDADDGDILLSNDADNRLTINGQPISTFDLPSGYTITGQTEETVNDTPVILELYEIEENKSAQFNITVIGSDSDGTALYSMNGNCQVFRGSGNAALVGLSELMETSENNFATNATILINSNNIAVSLVGLPADSVFWSAIVQVTETVNT